MEEKEELRRKGKMELWEEERKARRKERHRGERNGRKGMENMDKRRN